MSRCVYTGFFQNGKSEAKDEGAGRSSTVRSFNEYVAKYMVK